MKSRCTSCVAEFQRKSVPRPLITTADVEPIDWVLLTTCAVTHADEAAAVVGYYDERYLIEPVHRIWKSALPLH